MQNATPTVIAVLALELAPAAAFGFAGDRVTTQQPVGDGIGPLRERDELLWQQTPPHPSQITLPLPAECFVCEVPRKYPGSAEPDKFSKATSS